MKKQILLIAVILIIATSLKAQIPCTFTTCTPFNSSDSKQIYNAIMYTGASSPTGTASFKDNSTDTLNARLAYLRAIAGYLNTNGNSLLIQLYDELKTTSNGSVFHQGTNKSCFYENISGGAMDISNIEYRTKQAIDTTNTLLRGLETVSVVNTVTVAPHTVTVVNTVTVAPHNVTVTALPSSTTNLATSANQVSQTTKLTDIETATENLNVFLTANNNLCEVVSFEVSTNAAALKDAIATWMGTNGTYVIKQIVYSSYAFVNGGVTTLSYSAIVWYIPA